MSITIGPNLKKLISATDGDAYGPDLRAFLRMIDALVQCSVISRTLATPPGSPADGDRYIVAASPTGAWSGKANSIASWTLQDPANPTGIWEFYAPIEGVTVWSLADVALYTYHAAAWMATP